MLLVCLYSLPHQYYNKHYGPKEERILWDCFRFLNLLPFNRFVLLLFPLKHDTFKLSVFSQKASQPAIHIKSSTAFQSIQFEPNFDSTDSSLEEKDISIDQILNTQRDRIRRELDDYVLPYNQTLNNYTLETKGQPVRTVVFTTWRSGSTFLGKTI